MNDRIVQALSKFFNRHRIVFPKFGAVLCDRREIYRYRRLYLTYPQIVESLSPQLEPLVGKTILAGAIDE